MIFGIGTDILDVDRIKKKLSASGMDLMERLFTAEEIEYCTAGASQNVEAQRFAGRFAAKEAFLKALGTGLRSSITWHDMVISHTSMGKPEMRVRGRAASILDENRITAIHLSISHTKTFATAMVVLELKQENGELHE